MANDENKSDLELVLNDKMAIKYIKNPSEEVQLAAVMQGGDSYGYPFRYIKNPTEKVQLAAIAAPYGFEGCPFKYMKNPSKAVRLAAVKRENTMIWKINDPSEEEIKIALGSPHSAAFIKFMPNQTEFAKMTAVENDGTALKHIQDPSDEVKLAAVKQNGFAIQYIDNPTPELQRIACKTKPISICYVQNIDKSIIEEYKNDIIRHILNVINGFNGDYAKLRSNDIIFIVNNLMKNKINWPELNTIKASIQK